jgi:hypothetical protein
MGAPVIRSGDPSARECWVAWKAAVSLADAMLPLQAKARAPASAKRDARFRACYPGRICSQARCRPRGLDQELLLPASLRNSLSEDQLAWLVLEALAQFELAEPPTGLSVRTQHKRLRRPAGLCSGHWSPRTARL